MDDKQVLRQRIQQSILDGLTQEKIFINTYQDVYSHQKVIPKDVLPHLFGRTGKNALKKLPSELHPLVKFIHVEYKKFKNTLRENQCVNVKNKCFLKIISERYAFEIQTKGSANKFCAIYLHDMLTDQKHKMRIVADDLLGDRYRIESITLLNNNQFLVYYYNDVSYKVSTTTFQLMHLDLTNMTCKILETCKQKGKVEERIFGPPNQFLCRVYYGNNTFYKRGRVVDSKIEFDENNLRFNGIEEDFHGLLSYQKVFGTSKLEEDKLYNISLRSNYYEFDLKSDRIQCKSVGFKIEIGRTFDRSLWIDNIVYGLVKEEENDVNNTVLYKFNLETHSIEKFKWNAVNCFPIDMFYSGGVLIVCLKNEKTFQHVWKRFPISRPDTLLQLAMKFIRQQTVDKEKYNKLLKQLPAKFQPFKCAV